MDRFLRANPGEDKFIGATICKHPDGRCFLTVQATTIFPAASNKERHVWVIVEKEEATSLAAAKRRLAYLLLWWQEQG